MASKITMHKIQNTIAAGATTGTTFSKVIRGKILAVKVLFSNSTPGSSSDRDVNLFEMNPFDDDDVTDALQELLNIGTLGAAPADDNNVYYPRVQSQDNTGTGVEYASGYEIYEPFVIFGRVMLAVTSAAEADITTVYLMVEEY